MNERIRELAEQAGIDLYGDTGVEATQGNLQELAELIVKECADKLESTDIVHGYVAKFLSNEIKEHFGVEE